jgi:Flp pilus assembly protein TadD
MSHRYINTLLAAILIVVGGCASAPQERVKTLYPEATTAKTTTTEVITDVDGEFQAALQLMKSGNWHGAADKLAAITTSEPGLSGAWTNLGIARNKIGDTAGAEDALNKAIAANANQVVAYNVLGIIYRRSGRLEEAAASYIAGLNINPNDEDIHWNLAILYDRYLPNPVQALSHYERYQQLTQSEDKQLLAWISELREQTSQVNVATGAKR